jgi:hypothetical protein
VKHTRWFAALVALLVIAGACTRSDDEVQTGPEESEGESSENTDNSEEESGGDDATALSAGGFGDLESVCQDGDAAGATAAGVTDTEIRLGTVTDKGFAGIPGLNKEMYDTAVAFTEWCNEHGGILGRQLVLDDLDAKLTEYDQRIRESCGRDFALVGGGAVFDEDKTGIRVGCELINVAGFVVSPEARVADLQVQPIPNPVYSIAAGRYARAADLFPEGIKKYGIMAGAVPSVLVTRDQLVEVAESLDYDVVYNREYAPQGETGWANFVREMEEEGVEILDFVGQPEGLTTLTQAMDTAGWYPELIMVSTNFYDSKYQEEGGAVAGNTLIQSVFHPYEMADENKATQDFLDLMEQYNPEGKVAQLGTQGLSSWLLFAQAATACGSELTGECVLEEAQALEGWTGGGVHAPQQPGNTDAPACFLFVKVGADGFTYDEEATAPTDGIYNCDPGNVFELEGDYGVPRPEQ